MSLHYLRDKEKREVDFLVCCDNKPWFTVEAKLLDSTPSPSLSYFGTRLKIPHLYQVVYKLNKGFTQKGIVVNPAHEFLSGLP